MNCIEFQQRLEAAVDERRFVDSVDIVEHAAVCAACHELRDDFLLLEAAIADWRVQRLDVDLTERVLGAYRAERTSSGDGLPNDREQKQRPQLVAHADDDARETMLPVTLVRVANQPTGMAWWPMLFPAIAALALAVMVLMNRESSHELIVAKPAIDSAMKPDEFADLSEIVDDAKSAWLGLARTTAARTKGLGVFIPSLSISTGDEAAAPPMDADLFDDMNRGLTPVPDEFRKAFEFLIDAAQWDESQTT